MDDIFSVRTMSESDIDFGLSVEALSGWNQIPADWKCLLRYQSDGCFTGVVADRPVATITTTCYSTDLAWIGMMLVHPDFRRRGIATRMMKHALHWLQQRGTQCVKLDATPAGAAVYEQLGFQKEWDFHRFVKEGAGTANTIDLSSVSMVTADFVVPEFDTQAFGANRHQFLAELAAISTVAQTGQSFGMLRSGRLASYLGPVVANSVADAEAVIRILLAGTHCPVFWDVPGPNAAAMKLAERLGFRPGRDLTRMWRGSSLPATRIDKQFAIASPATG